MSYQVLSRKWRPQCFDEVVGQLHVIRTLQNAIDMDRVAHGYLFGGPRGVGKTTTARILAKILSCENRQDRNPCNKCANCKDITLGSNLDVQELDGASNRGIDEIRKLREAVKYPPSNNKYRIYIIDEVHMLTSEAFNALLKTLEEPPAHIVFILATTDVHKVPTTILSRTQKFDFKSISVNDISAALKGILESEKISYEDEGILLISQKADGSLRDSLSLLDQVIAYANDILDLETVREVLGIIEENVFLDVIRLIGEKNISGLITRINQLLNDGFAISDFISGFNEFLRHCMIHQSSNFDVINLSEESMNWLESKCCFSSIDLLRILDLSLQFESNLKFIQQPQISLEALFMKLALLENSIDIAQLLSGNTPQNISVNMPTKTNEPNDIKTEIPEEKNTSPKEERSEVAPMPKTIPDPPESDLQQSLTLEKINGAWKNIINKLEQNNAKIVHFLEDITLSKFDGTHLWIELINGHRFQKRTLEKDIETIEAEISSMLSEKIRIKFQMKENDENKTKENKSLNAEHPLFENVLETFEGEIIR